MKKYKTFNDVVCHLMDIQQAGEKMPQDIRSLGMDSYFQGIHYALEQFLEFDMDKENE